MVYTTGYKDGSGNDLSTVFVTNEFIKAKSNWGSFTVNSNNQWLSLKQGGTGDETYGTISLQDTSNNIISVHLNDEHYYYITTTVAGIYNINMNIKYTNGLNGESNPVTRFAFTTIPATTVNVLSGIISQVTTTPSSSTSSPGYISYNSFSKCTDNPNTGSFELLTDSSGNSGLGSVFYVYIPDNGWILYNFCTISCTMYLPADKQLYFTFACNGTQNHFINSVGAFTINLLNEL